MEQPEEPFDTALYQASNDLRHLPTPDTQPLEGAYFPHTEEKKPRIPTRTVTTALTLVGIGIAVFMFVALIRAATTP